MCFTFFSHSSASIFCFIFPFWTGGGYVCCGREQCSQVRTWNKSPRPPSYYFINYSFSFTKLIFIWRTPEHNFWFFRKTPPRVYHFLNFLFSNWIISFSVKLFSCSFLFHVQMLCTELTVSPLCTYPPFLYPRKQVVSVSVKCIKTKQQRQTKIQKFKKKDKKRQKIRYDLNISLHGVFEKKPKTRFWVFFFF
jgi:hypothetical protein